MACDTYSLADGYQHSEEPITLTFCLNMDVANFYDNHLPEYMVSQLKSHTVNIKHCSRQVKCNDDFCYTEISLGQQLMKLVFLMFITHSCQK